jgi:glucose-6-phosphate 1-dehydrogenase
MLQNHTFEMLLLTLCNTINNEVSERIELSSTFLPLKDSDVIKKQYIGYKQEVNNANSNVETFAKVTLHSSHPR